jgi:asparagine synthase (glutamine-hydrolysing)
MCGIAGFHYLDSGRPAKPETLKRMIDTLVHRGPDGEGMFVNDRIALGHRRLAIIDLASGQQPMYRQDKELILVFNGEIYNYIELREELGKLGHQFCSKSDSEVILAAYQQWGTDCVAHFNGMWAFALWDAANHRLFCSRDRAGEKPFFYASFEGAFVFGSEPKALFAYGVPRQIDVQHLDAYLCFGYVPAPYSFFAGINKLKAGHNLIIENGRLSVHKFWDVDFSENTGLKGKNRQVYDRFEELFTDAVRIRMRSDVPFGAFLSGGLDSGSVVSVMPGLSTKQVSTFTIGFNDQAFDERSLARLVAEKFGTLHTESIVSLQTGVHSIDRLAHYFDEPFGDSSALPTYAVSNEARKYVTMVLTGDGGDEVLSGYPVHQSEKLARWINLAPKLFRDLFVAYPLKLLGRGDQGKGDRLHKLYGLTQMPLADRILQKQNCFTKDLRT